MMKRWIAALLCALTLCGVPLTAGATILPGNTSKVDYDNTDPNRYWIEIDLTNQVITVYETATGTVAVQGLCTTGSDELPTGAGTYTVGDLKERFGYFVAYGQYAQYWTQVVRGVYIHSVMYDSKKLTSMSKSAYRNLGKNVSHGCVRVLPHVAQWIFYNCPPGTTCKITGAKTADAALVKALKDAMPAYGEYPQPSDTHVDPLEIPATVRYNNTPLRTGFSASKDKTVETLSAGDHALLLQIGADWCKVRTEDGELGYVKTAYMLFDPDATPKMQEAYAATKKTYLYESMDTGSEKLATLGTGTAVTVTDNPKSGWYSAAYGGYEGYVRTKYVKLSTTVAYPELPVAATTAVTVTNADGTTTTTTTATASATRSDRAVNMRASASTASALVVTLPASTPIHVISMDGQWYYCSTDSGYTGWLHMSCLG